MDLPLRLKRHLRQLRLLRLWGSQVLFLQWQVVQWLELPPLSLRIVARLAEAISTRKLYLCKHVAVK
jgi:hypothetical protein